MFTRKIREKEQILINLLPRDKKREKRRREIALLAGVMVIFLAGAGFWCKNMLGIIKNEEIRNRQLKQELKLYADKGYGMDYARLKAEVEQKQVILDKLSEKKVYYGSFLEVFQEINSSSPYISYMEVKPGYINIDGSGRDYDETLAYLEWLLSQEDVVIIEKLSTYTGKDAGRLNFHMSVRWESGKQ